MMKRYRVTTKSAEGVKTSQVQFASIDEALRSASALLNEGEPSVWIIDDDGNLILPPDQVRLRLNSKSDVSARSA